jgi:CBS domain-containing protein
MKNQRPTSADQDQILRDTQMATVNKILPITPVCVQKDEDLQNVAQMMTQNPQVHVACVVDDQQQLAGLLTLQNLTNDLLLDADPEEFLRETHNLAHTLEFAKFSATRTAGDAMTPAISINETDTVKHAFDRMHHHQLAGLPVVNHQGQVTGYISLLDLLVAYNATPGVTEGPA